MVHTYDYPKEVLNVNYGVNSKKIDEQINALFSEILQEQQKISALRECDEDKKHLVEKFLSDFTSNRGRGFFYNYLSSGRGHGPFTELVDGSVKYDLISAIGVNLLGHSHPLYIKAHLESAASDVVMCGNLLPYQEACQLSEQIIGQVKESRLKHFWFSGSGSFANDLALKMIWQKKSPNYKILACEKAFAGRSVATQEVTHTAAYRDGMPTYLEVDHVPHFDYKNPEGAADKTIAALEERMKENGPYAAITMELVQGEGGFIYGTKEYYHKVLSWAKSHDLFVWIDEIQTFGRTTELFSFQMFELDKFVDLVTVGKALQCCGILFTEELNPKPGLIAGTFNGSLVSLNAANKTVRYLREGNFYGPNGRIKELENKFLTNLQSLALKSCKDKITYCGGIGTMISFEVGDSSKETTMKYIKQLFLNGVIAFMAGNNPTRVRFLLPLSLTDKHIDEIMNIIEKSATEVL
jgi:4-aminobutyrate aminotransferase-like enzyme